ncbi:TIGR01906 family membrane protein [Clostridium sp.]|uniref:TIGR01906 family membrane protein n=1 Tax=Clostridium sp. TaxID=1506 RepID=UPI0032168A6B
MKKMTFSTVIVFLGIILVLLISTITVTKLKPIYDFSIIAFDIESKTDLSRKEMVDNYSYVVDYLLNNGNNFKLPSLPFSDDGVIHFNEVRDLFNLAKIAILIISVFLTILLLIYRKLYRDFLYGKYIGIGLITIPIILSVIVSINFNFFFHMFHKMFFNNDKWIFDPKTDPIINILPEEFFAICGVAILTICILVGVIIYIAYFINIRHKKCKKY